MHQTFLEFACVYVAIAVLEFSGEGHQSIIIIATVINVSVYEFESATESAAVFELADELTSILILHCSAILHAVRVVSANVQIAISILHLALGLHSFDEGAHELGAVGI